MNAKPNQDIFISTTKGNPPQFTPTGVYGAGAAQDLISCQRAGYSAIPPTLRSYPLRVIGQAQEDMQEVLATWPRLTVRGLADEEAMEQLYNENADDVFDAYRDDLLTPQHLAGFIACVAWLRVNATNPAKHAAPPVSWPGDDDPPKRRLRPGDDMPSRMLGQIIETDIGPMAHGVVLAAVISERYAINPGKWRNDPRGPYPTAMVDLALTCGVWERWNKYAAQERAREEYWRAEKQREREEEECAEKQRERDEEFDRWFDPEIAKLWPVGRAA
jgi:hypothetical protein